MSFAIISFSVFIGLLINIFIMKIISVVDYELLGLKNRSTSILNTYFKVFKNKEMFFRILFLQCLFIVFNCIVLMKIFKNFDFVMIYTYLKYYYLFLILYIFAFIDYITYYVYTLISYPSIVFSLIIFILSFLKKGIFKENFETLFLIALFYLVIKKFKFLGDGDFDIMLIVSLTLGSVPTIFIFYFSIISSGIVGIYIIFKNSFKISNNKMAFVPFVFLSTFLFIVSSI